MWLRSALLIGLVLTAANVIPAARRARALDTLKPLATGQAFSTSIKGMPIPSARCWTGFILEPNCPGCQHLVRTIATDTTTIRNANIVWIIAAPGDAAGDFVRTYSLPAERTFAIPSAAHAAAPAVLRRLGIRGVPTRVIVDGGGQVRDIQLGPVIPSDSAFNELCSGEWATQQ